MGNCVWGAKHLTSHVTGCPVKPSLPASYMQPKRSWSKTLILPEGPSTQYFRTLVAKTIEGMVLGPGTLNVAAWTLWDL